MQKKYWLVLITFLLLTTVTVSAVSMMTQPRRPVLDFTLTAHTGQTVTGQSLQGAPVIVFFGFTGCSSICPATLAKLTHVLDDLGPESAGVTPLFITVDPMNDTPESLSTYLHPYHPRIIGLTGTAGELQDTYENFDVFVQKITAPDDTFNHGGHLYLFDRQGEFAAYYTGKTQTRTLVRALKNLIDTQQQGDTT